MTSKPFRASVPVTGRFQAAQNVVPVAVTADEQIERLRQWASGRCLSADRAGVYSRPEVVSGGRVRSVVRARVDITLAGVRQARLRRRATA